MTIFSKRDDERRTSRADSRRSKRNELSWMGTWESPRLEPRTDADPERHQLPDPSGRDRPA